MTSFQPGRWRLVHQVAAAGQLLTLTTAEAEFYGISAATIADDDELAAWFGAGRIFRLDESWSEKLVRALVHPLVRGLLLVAFLVCLFIELSIPGFGIFGTAALVALALLVGAPLLAGLAQWWEVLLIVVGLGLIAVEVFVLPGFGLAGVLGVLCLLVGLVGTFAAAGAAATSDGRDDMLRGLFTTLGSFTFAGIAIWLLSRKLNTLPFMRRLTLEAALPSPALADSGGDGGAAALSRVSRALRPGDVGIAATDLRPSGRGQFDGRLVDVSSNAGWIERGSPIRVVSVARFEIEVEVTR